MPDRLPAGAPYREIPLRDGRSAPFYIVPFDKDGICTGPLTQANVFKAIERDKPTDVFLFSHGWNNDWSAATGRYDGFISGFADLRAAHPLGREFRPVSVGVTWPGTVLVAPWEEAPDIAQEVRLMAPMPASPTSVPRSPS